jgi:hypothetical protein
MFEAAEIRFRICRVASSDLATRDPVAGAANYLLLIVFAIMPRFV